MTDIQRLNMIQALNRALDDAMEADPKVLALGEDVADEEEGGVVGITRGLSTKYGPLRVRSTPISEQAIMGAAIGAALIGYRPVAEIMLMNFTAVAMDMICNHAAKLRFMSGGQTHVPLVIRTMTGAGLATGGQHSDYLETWFAHTPGLKVVAPATPGDAYGLMRSAIEDEDPVLFIENMPIYGIKGPVEIGSRVPIGKARIAREGRDVSIIAHSRTVIEALAAAEIMEAEFISVEVIDLRSILPWDKATVLASVERTGRAIVVHEAVREFGIGAEIASILSERLFGKLRAPVTRLGARFSPVPFAKSLESAHSPDRHAIAEAVRQIIADTQRRKEVLA